MASPSRTWFHAASPFLTDLGCLLLAFSCTAWLTVVPNQTLSSWMVLHASSLIVFAAVWCGTALDQRLYISRRAESLPATLFSVTRVYFVTLVLSGFFLALALPAEFDRSFFGVFALVSLMVIVARLIVFRPGLVEFPSRYSTARVIFLGAGEHVARLAEEFQSNPELDYHIVGYVEEHECTSEGVNLYEIRYLGTLKEIERILIENAVDEVYVTIALAERYEDVERIAHVCESIGVTVRLAGEVFPMQLSEGDIGAIKDVPLLSLSSTPRYLANLRLKRLIEVATALLSIVILAPVFLVIAALLKLQSKGPVLVRHGETGQPGKGRGTWRFRNVRRAVDDSGNPADRPYSRLGRFLHRSGLDELPQLFSVLVGETTFLGVPSWSLPVETAQRQHPATNIAPTFGLAALDACCIAVAYILSIHMTSATSTIAGIGLTFYLPFMAVLLIVWYAAAIERHLWRWRSTEPMSTAAFGLLKAMGTAIVICGFLLAIYVPGVESARRFLVAFCVLSFLFLLSFRIAVRFLSKFVYRFNYLVREVLIVGTNERTDELVDVLGEQSRFGYKIVGLLDKGKNVRNTALNSRAPLLGTVGELDDLLETRDVHEVYVTLPLRSSLDTIAEVVRKCQRKGKTVHVVGNLLSLNIAKCRTVLIGDIPLLSLSSRSETYAWQALKRICDFLAASVLILVFAPLFLVLAYLIKRDSEGPVFFVQDRIGQNHRYFKMIKFRSMVSNAEELKQGLMHLNEADGPVFKIKEDPRITPLGRFLRKYSFDELPQLFNVWLGHMSLVGPRPLMPHEVEKFEWSERRRLSVKPGMTGPWQVSGRNEIPFKEWVEMDLAYIDSWSFWQDFVILSKTFNAVVSGRGAN